jgi:hypothetical protein
MAFELLQIGTQPNSAGELARLDVEVSYGPKRATISLFPEPPLATANEAELFARREIQEMAKAALHMEAKRSK